MSPESRLAPGFPPEGEQEETSYRAVFEAAPDGIVIVDEEGLIRDLNPRLLTMFGYSREELMGRPVEVLVPETVRDAHVVHRTRYMEAPRSRPMGIGMELAGRRKDGSELPVEISLSPLPGDGDHLSVVAVVRDVSLRKRLREFGAGAMRAAEEERQKIARELHDDMAQRLSALLVLLRLVSRSQDVGKRTERLEEMRSQLMEVAEEVRRIARGLRPPVLADAGVVPALQAIVRDLRGSAGLDVTLETAAVDHLLTEDEKLVVYRVVQEALTNVVRHARASRVTVRLGRENDRVLAEVIDDGVGFEPDAPGPEGGLGLIGMQERAATVEGWLRLESRPGRGTTVRLEIPVDPEGEPHG